MVFPNKQKVDEIPDSQTPNNEPTVVELTMEEFITMAVSQPDK